MKAVLSYKNEHEEIIEKHFFNEQASFPEGSLNLLSQVQTYCWEHAIHKIDRLVMERT